MTESLALLRSTRRRQFIKLALFAGGASAFYSYSRFVGAKELEVVQTSIVFAKARLSRKIRILQLSDLHASSVNSLLFLEQAVELGIAQKPDLICFTGDYVTSGSSHDLSAYTQMLRKALPQEIPKYACLGNHDGGAWSNRLGGYADTIQITRFLSEVGFQVLNNDARGITIGDQSIQLIGLSDLWSGNLDAEKALLLPNPENSIRIVLAHNPDTKSMISNHPWDMMLSGHTHGGQVVLPFVGPIFTPVIDKNFVAGLNYWNKRAIYTTRGIGSLFGIRLNCRPEVSVLDLIPGV